MHRRVQLSPTRMAPALMEPRRPERSRAPHPPTSTQASMPSHPQPYARPDPLPLPPYHPAPPVHPENPHQNPNLPRFEPAYQPHMPYTSVTGASASASAAAGASGSYYRPELSHSDFAGSVPYAPAASYATPPPRTLPPPLPSISRASPAALPLPPPAMRVPDLSEISRGPLQIPEDNTGFVMSSTLQRDLLAPRTMDATTLHERVVAEATAYADRRKGLVRDALKQRQNNAGVALSPIDKSKLRSRREAKVHRVKERAFEQALKDAIKWFIQEKAGVNRRHVPQSRHNNNA